MRALSALIVHVSALCIFLDGALQAAWADDLPKVIPIGRYALETNEFHDLYDHVESIEPGGIKYDNEFRHPYLPLGALLIDCQFTHRIGATLALHIPPERPFQTGPQYRKVNTWAKAIKVRYKWSHSNANVRGRSYYVTTSPFSSGNVLSDGLTLTRKRRIEGIWTLSVTYDNEEIYRTGFQLFRCPGTEP